jgi:ABC-type phosphate/phosphonate transport system substrate-binding protein
MWEPLRSPRARGSERRHSSLVAGLGLLLAALVAGGCGGAGGASSADEYVIAFKVTEDRSAFVEQTEPLAEWIEARTGVPTSVLTVQDDRAQITALATGQAHAAYMSGGPAWVGWTTFDLEAIVAETFPDGSTSYVAGLWVDADSDIERVSDLEGARSCHTGELAGTGMFVPIGYLIENGFIDVDGLDTDDISSLREARERFFGQARIGGGYLGAFQCLSTGEGEVATGRHTAWEDFCDGPEREPWCLPRDRYRWLPPPGGPDPAVPGTGGLAEVPSHPVMVSPDLGREARADLRAALLALNETSDGRAVLAQVLEAEGLVPADTAEHLGPYGEVLEHVPGIRGYFGGAGR